MLACDDLLARVAWANGPLPCYVRAVQMDRAADGFGIVDEIARIAADSEQRRRDVARLASELSRWLTANRNAESAMGARVDELAAAIERLNELAQR